MWICLYFLVGELEFVFLTGVLLHPDVDRVSVAVVCLPKSSASLPRSRNLRVSRDLAYRSGKVNGFGNGFGGQEFGI